MTLLLAMMVQFLSGKLYERSGERLTEVPDNIPDDTTRVQLAFNHIQIVRQHAFSHLSLCVQLILRENIIYDIQRDAFYGLESLEILILSYNRLKVKQENRSALCHMKFCFTNSVCCKCALFCLNFTAEQHWLHFNLIIHHAKYFSVQ